MSCKDVKKRLNAWLDGELTDPEAGVVTDHLNNCDTCRKEAAALKQLAEAMDSLPVLRAPSSLSRNIRRRFSSHLEQQGLSEWWQGLSMTLRGAVCGAALAGLLFGAVLGKGLPTTSPSTTNPYLNLYNSQGYIP